jgi:hypothetical protein
MAFKRVIIRRVGPLFWLLEVNPLNKPWPQNVARYEMYSGPDASVAGMLALTRFIADSRLATGLYAWTSMFDLCITQTPVTHPYDGPFLRVSPQFNGKIEFRFIDTHQKELQWHRVVDAGDAIPRMVSFLDQLRWFTKGSLHDR